MNISGTSAENRMVPIEVRRSLPDGKSANPRPRSAPIPWNASLATGNGAAVLDVTPTLFAALEAIGEKSGSLAEYLKATARYLSEHADCLGLWVAEVGTGKPSPVFQPVSDTDANVLFELFSSHVDELVQHTLQRPDVYLAPFTLSHLSSLLEIAPLSTTGSGQHHAASSIDCQDRRQMDLVIAPLVKLSGPSLDVDLLLLACFEKNSTAAASPLWVLGTVSQAISNWRRRKLLEQVETRQRSLLEFVTLLKEIDGTQQSSMTTITVVNQLRRLLNVEQVSMTINGKLAAISEVEQLEINSEFNRIVQTACNVARNLERSMVYSGNDESAGRSELKSYCQSSHVEACLCVPMRKDADQLTACLLIGGSRQRICDPGFEEHVVHLSGMLAGHIDVVLRANRGLLASMRARMLELTRHRWRKQVALVAAGIAVLLSAPLPYRVGCDCELQPVLRRFVSSPYDGTLERSLVSNGEVVDKDQLIAELDGRPLRIELSGLQADLAGARKRRDSALAQGDIAQSQIARSEMERFESKIRLIEERLNHLKVRSPIAGMIVSGDLEKVEGAPLAVGQTLFEVAPLDSMISEIAIPESEIQHVQQGMKVMIKLSAFPYRTWEGTLQRIHPRAEILNDESVFVGEVHIDHDGQELRPGMKGAAKIQSHWSPLAWILFHRAWESVRFWTIW